MGKLVEFENITKTFPGVRALNGVSFHIMEGEILALLGENGAGKSTLTKIFGGVFPPDEGQILINGKPVRLNTVHDASMAGIGVVYQELSLIDSLSIAENLFAHSQPIKFAGLVDWKALNEKAAELLDRFQLDLDPRTPVKSLSAGQKQMIEILKVVARGSRIIVLDEPTSSLTLKETRLLFDILRSMRKQGLSFVYITHKLSELYEITDRIVILRDGEYVACYPTAEVNDQLLVNKMVGRDINDLYSSGTPSTGILGKDILNVRNYSKTGYFDDISFDLRAGEILGFAGLVGSGRTELAHALIGKLKKDSGVLQIVGNVVDIKNPHQAQEQGLTYLTESRKEDGLYLDFPIERNVVAPALKRFTNRFGFLNRIKIRNYVRDSIKKFSVATPSESKIVRELSGGNQQKCLLSMCLSTEPRVVILDEPTRGVDVGARNDIYKEIRELAGGGVGIILISSDLPELIGLADRIIVMSRGLLAGTLEKEGFSEETIMSHAAGISGRNK